MKQHPVFRKSSSRSRAEMMAILVRLFIFLSILITITASHDYFSVVGHTLDVNLDTQRRINLRTIKWMFDKKSMLTYTKYHEDLKVFHPYDGRVEFNESIFCLTLKNLIKNDTGKYKIEIYNTAREIYANKYTLTVLDPVVAPNLTYSRPQKSSDTCKVSCESQDLSVSTSCSNETCEAKNATSSNLNLVLHVTGTTVNCTVSNKAMWINTTLDIKLCEVSSEVFKVVGHSLDIHLDKQKIENYIKLKWMFKTNFMLIYTKGEDLNVSPAYEGRVEFNKSIFSLTLKNLMKNDTGNYIVKIDDAKKEIIIAEYTLTVLDPLVAPNLTYSRPQKSSDTCKVSCESQDLSVSTSCSNETCEAKNATSSNLNLGLHVNGTTFNCTVSNKAMWINTTLDIKLCEGNSKKPNSNGSSIQSCAVMVFTVLLVSVIVS
ncbi:uncharacterized protein LOC143483008 [Brachyhypopomus gauderio]|uniref:uncharacterized protein LOC143483008 n=1 Tax=Brachyhypopomus gauderio TaxID=698409 RepID=UPI004042BCD1